MENQLLKIIFFCKKKNIKIIFFIRKKYKNINQNIFEFDNFLKGEIWFLLLNNYGVILKKNK